MSEEVQTYDFEAGAVEAADTVQLAQKQHEAPEEHQQAVSLEGVEITHNGEKVEVEDKEEAVEAGTEASSSDEANSAFSAAVDTSNELKESFEAEGDKLAEVGLSLEGIQEEFQANKGKMTPETLAKIKEAGYSEKLIKGYLAGVTAAANEIHRQFMGALGGEDRFQSMTAWASVNADADLVDAFNAAVERDDLKAAASIGKVLMAAQDASTAKRYGTKNPHLLGGDAGANVSLKGFKSEADMISALNDKRYGNDVGFTRAVQEKIMAM
ncbi:capsid assembly protein [Chromobacterium haemolyticum]|uniref:capsid assembly protein n=1 Tax=Chromobacterium haemolyticum TaxID=394935 RepID=UPI000D2F95B1|nr:hypothetical protein [Chromobacterium haemolyticum]PTU68619.1 hypothetical protein DBB33_03755 [Chromobacterium haemolyticum]